jgi:altronate dehydratase
MIKEMLPGVNEYARQPVSVSEISLALQCGGSDGYSGITANPALGHCVDLLVQNGGTAILSETPEIYGAEHLLTRRAVDPKIADKLIQRIKWWENYTSINGGEMNNNPSPGNKAGGLTTILEKSLGAVAKGGTSNLEAVYEYAEPVAAHGFVYMDTPGYDPVSATGQVAGGAEGGVRGSDGGVPAGAGCGGATGATGSRRARAVGAAGCGRAGRRATGTGRARAVGGTVGGFLPSRRRQLRAAGGSGGMAARAPAGPGATP